ncbi:hypothetical protein ABT354_20080 [Streptomyces sp. NPDC000594]|uniref:hypothetical protein n=1 Tax=Streptomyces sp. NPDC000594 TaxID=3154261 RepID=UPI0033189A29
MPKPKTPKRPTARTERLLFGASVHCAFPSCDTPVVVFIDGLPSPGAAVAHIRSAVPGGPRHDPSYDKDVCRRSGSGTIPLGNFKELVLPLRPVSR